MQNIVYNAFKAPVSIEEQKNIEKINFTYNIFQQRSRMDYNFQDGAFRKTKHYAWDGSMEIKVTNNNEQDISFITYIGGDAYSAPVIYKVENGETSFKYLHRDYLGSIVAITNEESNIVEKRAFNAWGELAFLQDEQGNNLQELSVIDSGYTGHEHLAKVGLINMNARLYDAKVHRFLAPDNYIQDPYNTQNYNRYGYVLNNPLKYADPSGDSFILAAAIIGAIVGGLAGGVKSYNSGGSFFDGAWKGALVGGIIGGLSAGAGGLVTGAGFWAGAASGTISGFTAGFLGTTYSAMQNGSGLGDSLLAGLKGGLIGGLSGGIIGGVVGGIRATRNGLDFFKSDKVTDAKLFNSIFSESDMDVACTSCNFMQGDRISEFKADLSIKNKDYSQLAKAYKKAKLYTSYYKKNIKMGEIFDFSKTDKWASNGWKKGALNEWRKTFINSDNELMEAMVGGYSSYNKNIQSVGASFFNSGYNQIGIHPSGYYSYRNLSTLRFISPDAQWGDKFLNYLNDFTRF